MEPSAPHTAILAALVDHLTRHATLEDFSGSVRDKTALLHQAQAKGLVELDGQGLAVTERGRQLHAGEQQPGFTLIEISIVLVIIGLIVGGVLGGRELVRAAELRNVITQIDQYKQAVFSFEDKYDCLPGDCSKATSFWGAMGNCSNPPYTTAYALPTCNGNGNGKLIDGTNAGNPGNDPQQESLLFWQHLSNAGLINQNYNGISDQNSYLGSVAGVNVPIVKAFTNAFITATFESSATASYLSDTHWFSAGTYYVGKAIYPFLTEADAYSIDAKIDDGLPVSGSVIGDYWNSPTDRCPSNPGNTYDMAMSGVVCNLRFKGGF